MISIWINHLTHLNESIPPKKKVCFNNVHGHSAFVGFTPHAHTHSVGVRVAKRAKPASYPPLDLVWGKPLVTDQAAQLIQLGRPIISIASRCRSSFSMISSRAMLLAG